MPAARANGNYPLVYALLASGADAASATKALQCVSCGYRNTADQPAALTSALALAFGADSSGNQKLLDFAYNMKDGKCVKPADGKSADTCEWLDAFSKRGRLLIGQTKQLA